MSHPIDYTADKINGLYSDTKELLTQSSQPDHTGEV
jgi:hypothetical protein